MGGVGSGGRRRGSGRKRKTDAERALDGDAGHLGRPPDLAALIDARRRGRLLQHPAAPGKTHPTGPAGRVPGARPTVPDVPAVDEPAELTPDEQAIWRELAPHAVAAQTLGPATAFAFRRLVRNIALEHRFAASAKDAGSAGHRALIKLVDGELIAFQLAPAPGPAKPAAAPPAVDPLESKYF